MVETLVAISIFTISLIGLMSVLASGISDTSYAKKKMTAEYLSQEGVEYVRNIRDTYVVNNAVDGQAGWNSFKSKMSICVSGNECGFVKPAPGVAFDVALCSTLNQCKLYLNSGSYDSNATGADSGFVRKVWADTTTLGPDEVRIYSNVSWKQGSGTYNATFSEDLFNWVQ